MFCIHKIITFTHSYLILPGGKNLWFLLRNVTYQNNSLVNLVDIGIGDDALFCKTDLTHCCNRHHGGTSLGNWLYPNKTIVPSNQNKWDFYRGRSNMAVVMHHRRGGVNGIYRCEIPDTTNVPQTIYIGVYNTSTGE